MMESYWFSVKDWQKTNIYLYDTLFNIQLQGLLKMHSLFNPYTLRAAKHDNFRNILRTKAKFGKYFMEKC